MFSLKNFKNGLASLLVAFILFVLLPLPAAQANMAEPPKSGHASGEPLGTKDIFITRETLTIDLRPLAEVRKFDDPQTILVEAVYAVENKGGEKTLDLWFAFGSGQKEFHVWLDDKELMSTRAAANSKLPDSWKIPQKTPNIDGGEIYYYALPQNSLAPVAFSAAVPTGEHRFRIRYKAEATRNIFGDPTVLWQFAYILSPAREWAGFGGLDLQIIASPDWKTVSNLNLTREGDIYKGVFNEIPADALTLSTQAPTPTLYTFIRFLSISLFLLMLFGCPLALLLWHLKNRFRQPLRWVWAVLFTLLWTISIFASGIWAITGARFAILPGQMSPEYGYGSAFLFLLLIAVALASLPVSPFVWLNIIANARKAKKE